MINQLKLMADYDCFPLWKTSNGEVENIAPNSLNISEELIKSLYRWAAAYDATLNQDYPPNSSFATEEELNPFEKEGRKIFNELKYQLKNRFEYSFYSQKESKLYK
jgi:hypothetical protein